MPRWTQEQKEAIESRQANLLVSAAAGSGKTAVLVERIIQLILEDQTDIDRLLIVTFTNAAAGEMRERILAALVKALEEKRGDEQFLRRQISRISRSYIMTVHAFCIDVVRRHFYEADLNPTFRIGDTTELSLMLEEAIDQVMEAQYEEGHPAFHRLVESYGSGRTDDRLRDLLLKVYYFIQSKPHPGQWLKDQTQVFDQAALDFESSPWVDMLMVIVGEDLRAAEDILKSAAALCELPDGPLEYGKTITEDQGTLLEVSQAATEGVEALYGVMAGLKHPRLATIKKARKEEVDPALVDEVKALRDIYKKKVMEPLKQMVTMKPFSAHQSDAKDLAPVLTRLAEMVDQVAKGFDAMKRDQNLLDFNDLEHYAIDILSNGDIAKGYREKFDYIFMDEYQDSNIVQETIVGSIKRDNNTFLVGDVKQSIYRFRLADPSLFLEKYDRYDKVKGSVNQRIDLSKNFRSRDQVLFGINEIFSRLMSKSFGELDYDENAALYPGLDFQDRQDPSCHLTIIDASADEALQDEDLKEMKAAQLEAIAITKKIQSLIGQPTYDGKNGVWKPIRFGDIVVLLRATRSWSGVFHDVFAEAGIPLYTDAGAGYFDALEVDMFLSLLRVIDNRAQDLPLLTVLRSPIGGFSTDDLVQIRLRQPGGHFHEAFVGAMEGEDPLALRCKEFWDLLATWADQARYKPLNSFLWQLLMDTGFYHYAGAMPGGSARQANLRVLVDRAGQMQKHNAGGLFYFIRFVDRLKKSAGDLGAATAVGEHEDVVRLMSIHKSKGLEFPVVIVGGMGKKFNLRDTQENLLLHKDVGLGPKFVDPDKRIWSQTLSQAVMKRTMLEESLSEEMRILYVALTRAVDCLYLVGTTSRLESDGKKWSRGVSLYQRKAGRSYLDWVSTILAEHPDGGPLRDLSEWSTGASGSWQSRWQIDLVRKDQLLAPAQGLGHYQDRQVADKEVGRDQDQPGPSGDREVPVTRDVSQPEPQIYGQIQDRFDWAYPHEQGLHTPFKLAVSDIKRLESHGLSEAGVHIPKLIPQPKFLVNETKLSAADRGTLHHFVMQHLHFGGDVTEEGIQKQVEGLYLKALITEAEHIQIDCQQIAGLFTTDLGRRMLQADRIHREVPFMIRRQVQGESILVQGIIDCYFEEEGQLVLVDYKTDFTGFKTKEAVAESYRVQLQLYKDALEALLDKKVKEAHVYLFDAYDSVALEI